MFDPVQSTEHVRTVMDALTTARCQLNIEEFSKAVYGKSFMHAGYIDNNQMKERFEEFQSNPWRAWTRLDLAGRRRFAKALIELSGKGRPSNIQPI